MHKQDFYWKLYEPPYNCHCLTLAQICLARQVLNPNVCVWYVRALYCLQLLPAWHYLAKWHSQVHKWVLHRDFFCWLQVKPVDYS